MTKIAKLSISLTLSVAVSIAMIVVGNDMNSFKADEHSETFAGYVSEKVYDNRDRAAKAFLECELTGSTFQPTYKGYKKISDLNSNEIRSFGIPDLTDKTIVGGEHISVEYTDSLIQSSAKTYLLETIDSGYLYFVAPQETGEALTNCYLNSVLDGKKYSNCTSTTTLNMRLLSSVAITDTTYRQNIYFDGNKAFFNQELPGYDTDFYFLENGNSITVFMEHPTKKDGKFYTIPEINETLPTGYYYEIYLMKGGNQTNINTLTSMQDVVDIMFMLDFDASYFVKTDVGFSMTEDKYKEICKMMAGENFASKIEDAWTEYRIHFKSDYYVTAGRLSASQLVLTMSNGDEVFALSIETKYSDFGTTKVTLPR